MTDINIKLGGIRVYIDNNRLETLRRDKRIKKDPSHTNAKVLLELFKILGANTNHLTQNSNIEKVVNFSIFKDRWLQNEGGTLSKQQYWNYTRGNIVMSVDFGTTNIGTEIRYPHPAVVLYDQKEDWVIAAPITAAKLDSAGKPYTIGDFEVLARKQNNAPGDNKYWFRKHSVIQVDQIQRISKHRIVNKKSYRIEEHLLNQIDNILLEKFIPSKHKLTEKLKKISVDKKEEVRLLTDSLWDLHIENKTLKSELEAIKSGKDSIDKDNFSNEQ